MIRQIVIHRAEEDETGYWAECPSLPGCVSQGETIEETITNMKDAIQGYITSLEKRGLPIPEETFEQVVLIEA